MYQNACSDIASLLKYRCAPVTIHTTEHWWQCRAITSEGLAQGPCTV